MPVLQLLLRASALFLLWYALSGKTDSFYLVIGGLSSLAIAWISLRSQPAGSSNGRWNLVRLPLYLAWLLSRILLAALHVTRIILSRKMPLNAGIFEYRTHLRSTNAQVLLANSITMTPGTITTDLSGGRMLIHQMDDDSRGDITSGTMEQEIRKVFPGES